MFFQYQEEITTEDGVTLVPPVTVKKAEPAVPVKGVPAPSDGYLPETGFDPYYPQLGAFLLVIGGLISLAMRKRRTRLLR